MLDDIMKIWRSPNSAFGKATTDDSDREDETLHAAESYTDEELLNIQDSGFNAIWVHGALHHMISEEHFPEFGTNSDAHIGSLRKLIERAAGHGLKVFIYMQPPRSLPSDHPFFTSHPELAGHTESRLDDDGRKYKRTCLCTSQPSVLEYVKNACRRLSEQLPGLGGVIIISASEYMSHCLSSSGNTVGEDGSIHQKFSTCPHCRDRKPAEVIGELLSAIRDGIRQGGGDFPILAWNWSWSFYYTPPCNEILSRLPKDVTVLSGFERGGRQDYCGRREVIVDEYSLSYAGPSEQFSAIESEAEKLGLPVAAKLQLGTTHELASVVSLPLMDNIYRKAAFIRTHKLAGFMGCWNFGNQHSANTAGFNFFLSGNCPENETDALLKFAEIYFPGCNSEAVVAGWRGFTRAMRHYPFSIPFLYMGPINYTLAYILEPGPLSGMSAGRSWLDDTRGDDLSAAFSVFSAEESIRGLWQLADDWDKSLAIFDKALSPLKTEETKAELGNARICAASFLSAANSISMYLLKKNWNNSSLDKWKEIARNELGILENILPYVERDPRQGYHSEAHAYMFSPALIRKKMEAMEKYI